MKAYIVRHGQTLFNLKHIVQGWCDSPLTKLGIEQAKQAGEKLKNVDFEWAYCSTSERAVDTMNSILEGRNVSKSYCKGLKEINFGTMDGEKEDLVFNELNIKREDMPLYDGESPDMALNRFESTLLDISKNHNGNVLIVCHGGIMVNLMRKYAPDALEQSVGHPIPNCCILVFEIKDSFKFIEKF